MREKTLDLSAFTSTALLFCSTGSRRHGIGDGLVPAWLAAAF